MFLMLFKMCMGYLVTSSILLLSPEGAATCDGPFIDPAHLIVRYGEPAGAVCTALDPTVSLLGWESPVGANTRDGRGVLVWKIASLTNWTLSRGIKCFSNSDAKQCKSNLSITIYKHPTIVSIRALSDVNVFFERQLVQLECVVQDVAPFSHLKVKWFKGQEELTLPTNITVEGNESENVTVTQKLELTAGREDHGAQYRCEAELEIEGLQPHPIRTSQPLGISVFFAPMIKCPSKVEVRQNETLPNCTAEGNPLPEITWFKGHQHVDARLALSKTDGGRYTVTARNILGDVNQTVDVEIWYGPIIMCPPELKVKENEILNGCTVEGNPTPEVTWHRSGQKLDPISALGNMDGGNYTLFAESKYASVRHTVEVVIISKGSNMSLSVGVLLVLLLSLSFHR